MENLKTKPKDFFLIIGSMVALYAIVINLLNLLFTIINYAYPAINTYYYGYYNTASISFPVAFLIIVFPIFVVIDWFLAKSFTETPEKKDLPIKKWLSYLTLFISGLVVAGSLVTVLYYFLDGKDLTAGFLLKFLSVFVVSVLVFGYYISDIKDILTSRSKKIWLSSAILIILISIVLGFVIIGSPKSQRLKRLDFEKINDIQQLQSSVVSFWQVNNKLPQGLEEVRGQYGYFDMNQPDSSKPYEYSIVSPNSFEICAEFNFDSGDQNNYNRSIMDVDIKYNYTTPSDWSYKEGRSCFTYVINEEIYKPSVR